VADLRRGPTPASHHGIADTVVSTDSETQTQIRQRQCQASQPKRISRDAIRTPDTYTTDAFDQHLYNLIFIDWADMVLLLKTNGQDNVQLRGVFDIAGCKGYPELLSEGNSYFPDFFPDFKDTLLTIRAIGTPPTSPAECAHHRCSHSRSTTSDERRAPSALPIRTR
jgi:hypothetical protein